MFLHYGEDFNYTVEPDQRAHKGAIQSGYTLFAIFITESAMLPKLCKTGQHVSFGRIPQFG